MSGFESLLRHRRKPSECEALRVRRGAARSPSGGFRRECAPTDALRALGGRRQERERRSGPHGERLAACERCGRAVHGLRSPGPQTAREGASAIAGRRSGDAPTPLTPARIRAGRISAPSTPTSGRARMRSTLRAYSRLPAGDGGGQRAGGMEEMGPPTWLIGRAAETANRLSDSGDPIAREGCRRAHSAHDRRGGLGLPLGA